MISDPYRVLGLTPSASDDEVTKAYRHLAKKYHPDLNPGDKAAAEKMSEINAAYEQIKSGNVGAGSSQSSYGGNAGYYGGRTGYYGENRQSYGNGFGGQNNDPFSDFDPFSAFWSFGNFGSYGGQRQRDEFDPVLTYIRSGYYEEALNALRNISNHNAKWFYYSAIANYSTGNKVTALNHAQTAVRMEPGNAEYQNLLNQIQSGGRVYSQERSTYRSPLMTMNTICLGLCMARILCMCCAGGGGIGGGGVGGPG